MFNKLYSKVLSWSRHRHAEWYLGGLSFAESSFFPIPPDVLLAPMSLAQPEKAVRFALLTTIASVLGGIFGYLIGYFFIDLIIPWLENSHYWEKYLTAREWFAEWGFWAVFIAGFSPIPYKVFTLTAGALSMAFIPFVIASAIGRGARFFLVAMLLSWGGERLEKTLHIYINRIGWGVMILLVAGILIYKL
ncbi:MAG: DedA family protein [Gammaproteobacteria bacterium]|nr:MAG: DedA family protein [Gammaproteobacteria bacterium]RLA21010.1 MAG: DedA family protein [Gammaproteobacteria bacterium]